MPWLSDSLPGSDIIVPPSGTGAAGMMFFGEAAGENERRERRPFVERAQAGSVLHRAFRYLGINRNDVTLTNTVWWQPPNNFLDNAPWQGEAIARCRDWNLKLIADRRPKVLVALGKIAFHELTGLHEVEISQGRGFIVQARAEYGGLPVVPTYHPSFIIRGSKRRNEETGAKTERESGGGWGFYDILTRDLALARLVLQHGSPAPDTITGSPDCNLYGQRQDWEEVIRLAKANPTWPISYDFETPLSVTVTDETEFEQAMGNITQFQVSLRPGHALVSSWDPTLFPLIKALLELPNPKLDWNGRGFDRKILRDLGVRVDNTYRDVMWMWHHVYRDWPMGLQFATSFVSPSDGPWKHTFHEDLRSYGARDVHEPHKIFQYCQDRLRGRACPGGRDLLSGYERQVLLYQNVVFHPLQVRGIPIDNDRREKLDTVLERIETQVTAEIQPMVPEAVKPVEPVAGWKGLPPEWMDDLKVKAARNAEALLTAINAGQEFVELISYTGEPYLRPLWRIPDNAILPEYVGPEELVPKVGKTSMIPQVKVTKALLAKLAKQQVEVWISEIEAAGINRWVGPDGICVRRMLGKEGKERLAWSRLAPFNPNSANQKLAYIAHRQVEEIQAMMETRARYYKSEEEAFAKLSKLTKYKIPLDFKTKRPTTGKKEIDRLIDKTSDEVLTKCREVTEVTKLRGTYIGKMTPAGPTGWHPHQDGRVHPFYHDGPATGQGAARDPNSLNFPKHLTRKLQQPDAEYLGFTWKPDAPLTLGKAIRSMVAAPPGHRLVAADYRAFHVLTTGYEANDPKYMRLARLDMHSFFAATRLVKVYDSSELLRMSDKDLSECLNALKADKTPRYHVAGFQDLQPFKLIRDKMAKPAILGYGFGLQAAHLQHDNQEFIRTVGEAERLIVGLDEEFPVTYQWRKNIPGLAERQGGWLISKHGYIRHFNCLIDRFMVDQTYQPRENRGEKLVKDRDGNWWCIAPGDDNEACIAFLPANDAFGMIREGHLRMSGYTDWYSPVQTGEDLMEKYGFIIPLHDENVWCCRTELVDQLLEDAHREMTRESDVLRLPDGSGLWCDVEFQISPDGGSWAEMQDLKMPARLVA